MIWFTGCPHYDHDGVIEMCNRPFKTLAEMNDCLIAETNEVVQRTDELYILGDYCWKRPGHFRQAIKCRKVHLIWGNHDKANFASCFSSADKYRTIKFAHTKSQLNPDTKINCFLSHYPHAFWPGSHKGHLHLYSHMHRQRESWLDNALGAERRSLDCGVDNIAHLTGHYRPISEFEVASILMNREGHDKPEFYKAFQAATRAKGIN